MRVRDDGFGHDGRGELVFTEGSEALERGRGAGGLAASHEPEECHRAAVPRQRLGLKLLRVHVLEQGRERLATRGTQYLDRARDAQQARLKRGRTERTGLEHLHERRAAPRLEYTPVRAQLARRQLKRQIGVPTAREQPGTAKSHVGGEARLPELDRSGGLRRCGSCRLRRRRCRGRRGCRGRPSKGVGFAGGGGGGSCTPVGRGRWRGSHSRGRGEGINLLRRRRRCRRWRSNR